MSGETIVFFISSCIKWTQTYAENQKVLIGRIYLQTCRIFIRMYYLSDRFILHLRLRQTYASWSQTVVNRFILLEQISVTLCLPMHTFMTCYLYKSICTYVKYILSIHRQHFRSFDRFLKPGGKQNCWFTAARA